MKNKFVMLILFSMFLNFSASAAEPAERQYGDFLCAISGDTVSILKYTGNEDTVTIPSKMNGLPVVSVGEEAFAANLTVKSISVPEGVLTIKTNAFSGCISLEEIQLPEGLTDIADGAFQSCKKLSSVTLPSSLLTVHGYAFRESGIEELDIPEGVTYMDGSFYNCSKLKVINLPSSLEYIFPDEHIGTFYFCESLTEINVAKDNEYYFSKSGVFFQKDTVKENGSRQYLYCYPASRPGKIYTVPKNTYIMICAFDNCKYLRNVFIPEGIKNVSILASNCKKLAITIPRSVATFPSDGHQYDYPIFKNCTDCYAKVYKGSPVYQYCKKNKIPYVLIKEYVKN